ncbi:MAG: HlyD family type I secretion periplasmic adaptor subunit, partial [Francisellaceae bacterium]|nr:HlyD family type I secretion periplasmic adaptor subunit [Francisellaceae bacterium]
VADRDTLLSRQHSIELEILRHEYFAASTKITQLEIRENIESTPNNMLAQESLDLISQENNTYTSKKSILQESIDKELTALKQLGKQLINRTKRVGILKQANEIYEELELSNSVSKIKVIDAREKLNETEADLLSIETKIEAQKHTLDQKQQELSAFKDKSNYENMQKLNKARASHMEIQEALEHYIDQSENLKIKATVSGIIQDLIFDVGTVISPGEQILEIVPSQRELIVKAKLPSKHIANIRLGNPVKVRVSSYNYIRYGSLNGKVESISISTFSEKNLAPYYKINIRLDQNTLATSKIDLLPGMTVTADIVSGNRTIIEYLLRPIIHSVKMAFTEH